MERLLPLPTTSRGRLLLVLLLGSLVLLPAVRCAYLLDDFMHASMVTGSLGMRRGPADLYDFVNDADRPLMMEQGLLPWWSHPKLTIRFFRPLSSALRYAELELLPPGSALIPHIHSLLWWALAVLAAFALLSRLLPPRPAQLATAIFALGPWHVLPVAWLANREVLMSVAFGFLGLLAQLRLRDEGKARDAVVATLFYACAFGSGEYAFCLGGYVLVAELVVKRGSLVARALRLLPFGVSALGYLVVRRLGGYGTFASSFYADPLSEPLKILRVAPQRIVRLLAEGWLTLGTDAWGTTAPPWVIVALVLVSGFVLWRVIAHLLRTMPAERRPATVFLLAGSLVALLPVLAAVPAPRLLGISALGMAGVVGLLLDEAWFPAAPRPRVGKDELLVVTATLLGFLQLLHGPAAAYLAAEGLRSSSTGYVISFGALGQKLVDGQRRDVHVLRGGGGAFFGHFALAGIGLHPRWRILSQTPHVLMLRKDAHSFELVAATNDALYPEGATNLFRDPGHPLRAGDVVEVPGMRVQVLVVGPHGPTRARFSFDEPLDSQRYTWIDEKATGLTEVGLPRAGFGRPYDP
jgi:hypothetical protein